MVPAAGPDLGMTGPADRPPTARPGAPEISGGLPLLLGRGRRSGRTPRVSGEPAPCSTGPLALGTVERVDCCSPDELPAIYDKVTVNDVF